MKIHDFMNFHENHRKVKNVPAAAHRAQKLLIPMLLIGILALGARKWKIR